MPVRWRQGRPHDHALRGAVFGCLITLGFVVAVGLVWWWVQ